MPYRLLWKWMSERMPVSKRRYLRPCYGCMHMRCRLHWKSVSIRFCYTLPLFNVVSQPLSVESDKVQCLVSLLDVSVMWLNFQSWLFFSNIVSPIDNLQLKSSYLTPVWPDNHLFRTLVRCVFEIYLPKADWNVLYILYFHKKWYFSPKCTLLYVTGLNEFTCFELGNKNFHFNIIAHSCEM